MNINFFLISVVLCYSPRFFFKIMKYFEIADDSLNNRLVGSISSLRDVGVFDPENLDSDCPSSNFSRRILSEEDFHSGLDHLCGANDNNTNLLLASEEQEEVLDTAGRDFSVTREASRSGRDDGTLYVRVIIEEAELEIGGGDKEDEGEVEEVEEEDGGRGDGKEEGGGDASLGVNSESSSTATQERPVQEPEQIMQKDILGYDSDSDSDVGIYDGPDDQERKRPVGGPSLAVTTEFLGANAATLTKHHEELMYPKELAVNPPRELVCNAVMFSPGCGARFAFEAVHNALSIFVPEEPQVVAPDDEANVDVGCLHAIQQIIPDELQRFSALMVVLIKTLAAQGLRKFSVVFDPPRCGPGPPLMDTDPTPTAFGMPPTGMDTMARGMPDHGMDTWATGLPPLGMETGAIGFPPCQGWC